jgi:hypothetical protein
MILLFSQRITFCSPELHFLEKKGLIVVQKLQVLAPPEHKIGQNMIYDPSTHPSIVEIKNRVDIDNNFDFQNITAERVQKLQVLAPPEQRSKK